MFRERNMFGVVEWTYKLITTVLYQLNGQVNSLHLFMSIGVVDISYLIINFCYPWFQDI